MRWPKAGGGPKQGTFPYTIDRFLMVTTVREKFAVFPEVPEDYVYGTTKRISKSHDLRIDHNGYTRHRGQTQVRNFFVTKCHYSAIDVYLSCRKRVIIFWFKT